MDDQVPLHLSSGAFFRRSVGEMADVCRRGAAPDDDRRRLFTDGVAIFPEAGVRRSGRFREVLGGRQCYWCPVDRRVRSLEQRHRVRQSGVREAAGSSWHPPRVHTRSTMAWSCGIYSDDG